jgi:hypothetical protein
MIKSELIACIAEQNPHLFAKNVKIDRQCHFRRDSSSIGQARSRGIAWLWDVYRKDLAGSAWAKSKDRGKYQYL